MNIKIYLGNKNQKEIHKNLEGEINNIFCIGCSGTGKTTYFLSIIKRLSKSYSKKNLNLLIYDRKNANELDEFKNDPLLINKIFTSKKELNVYLDKLLKISYQRLHEEQSFPSIVFALDLFDINSIDSLSSSIIEKLSKIIKNSLHTKIHIFINTQSIELLNKEFVALFDTKIAFYMPRSDAIKFVNSILPADLNWNNREMLVYNNKFSINPLRLHLNTYKNNGGNK